MSKEKKLKQLLHIATDSAWNSKRFEYFIQTIKKRDFYSFSLNEDDLEINWFRFSRDFTTSLDTVVSHFEPNEISFLEALSNSSKKFELTNSAKYSVTVRQQWNLLPSSQRLEFLFNTFSHLLED